MSSYQTGQTITTDGEFTPLPGWPCVPFLGAGPAIDDKLSNPSADDLLPQVQMLAPRGAAWGTDEAGDGEGAGRVQRLFWRALAAWTAASYARDFEIYSQAYPSLVTWSLSDCEIEYGLPDRCITDPQSSAGRLQAVRVKYALVGATSPDYLICLGASLGYALLIEEYSAARIGARIGDRIYGMPWGDVFKVHAPEVTVTPARIGARIGDRLASWGNAELECAIDAAKQPQTHALFAYDLDPDGSPLDTFTLDDGSAGVGDALA